MGLDMAIFWIPSYTFKGMTNQQLYLQQMETLAQHIMPKFAKSTGPIEMDFDGTLTQPFASL